jgi:uncharacterized protein YecE (DUF72 family)
MRDGSLSRRTASCGRTAFPGSRPTRPGLRGADAPGGSPSLVYMRLHGSPRVYFSSYEEPYLEALAGRLRRHAETGAEVWCIFDNTAHGAAAPNALALLKMMSASA